MFRANAHNPSPSADIPLTSQMFVPSPSYNTALYPKWKSSPIVSIEGLLRLVALVAQYRATLAWNTQGGAACQSDPSPPASRTGSAPPMGPTTVQSAAATGGSPQSNDHGSDRVTGAEGGQL